MRFILFVFITGLGVAKSQVSSYVRSIPINVDVSYSRPLATFRFLETLSGHDPNVNEQIFNYLFSSEDVVLNNTIALFNSINVDYTFVWEDYPNTRRKHRSTYDLLISRLATSKNIQDLPQKLIGIIPYKDLNILLLCLDQISPYYNEYIGHEYLRRTDQEIAKYKTYTPIISESLSLIQQFYSANWPKQLPLVISLLPTPGKAGFTSASPHSNILACTFLTDDSLDYMTRIGVITHEACHVFYDAQPIELQNSIERWFQNHPSLYRDVAYKYFDEGLATAIGNGWMYEKINHKHDTGGWYNNPFIDSYGKALLPLVKYYINETRVIDSFFVDSAIHIFERQFPSSIYEYVPLMNSMTIFSNTGNEYKIKEFSKTIKEHFQVYSYEFITPFKTAESTEAISKKRGTSLFIIENRYRSNMNYLKSVLPELSLKLEHTRVPFKRNQYYSYINNQNEAVIIALISDTKSLEALLKAMKKETYINPDVVFHDLSEGNK